MKATELLVNQHRDVEDLFEKLDRADPTARGALREELAKNLLAHARIEEDMLYPAMKGEMPSEVAMSYEEHAIMVIALAKLLATRPNDAAFRARAAVLEELVSMHIRKEEEDVLRRAETALGADMLEHLGEKMQAEFDHLVQQGYRRLLRVSLEAAMPAQRGRAAKAPGRRAAQKGVRGRAAQKGVRAQAKRTAKRSASTAKRGAAAGRKTAAKAPARKAKAGRKASRKMSGSKRTTGARAHSMS